MASFIPGAAQRALQKATALDWPVLQPWMFGLATVIAVVAAIICGLIARFSGSNKAGMAGILLGEAAVVLFIATAAGRFVTGHW